MRRNDGTLLLCDYCQEDATIRCRECCPDDPDDVTPGFSEIGEAQDMLASQYEEDRRA